MSKLRAIFLILSIVTLACNSIPFFQSTRPSPQSASTITLSGTSETVVTTQATPTVDVYQGLRSLVFSLDPENYHIEPGDPFPNVWAVLMEFRVSEKDDIITLASIADGTTGLYFSNGGGILGGGEHEPVATATFELLSTVEDHLSQMSLTTEFPPPSKGYIRFYALTFSGVYTAEVPQEDIFSGTHEFSSIFSAADEVIAQIQLHTQN